MADRQQTYTLDDVIAHCLDSDEDESDGEIDFEDSDDDLEESTDDINFNQVLSNENEEEPVFRDSVFVSDNNNVSPSPFENSDKEDIDLPDITVSSGIIHTFS